MLLFVYGTLLAGEVSHAELGDARFVAPARTAPVYELVDLGEYPALVRRGAVAVQGELYEVDAARLAHLDAFEGHPELFRRARVRLAIDARAEAYFLPRARARGRPRIASGSFGRR